MDVKQDSTNLNLLPPPPPPLKMTEPELKIQPDEVGHSIYGRRQVATITELS